MITASNTGKGALKTAPVKPKLILLCSVLNCWHIKKKEGTKNVREVD
jgi:hypothetical protein